MSPAPVALESGDLAATFVPGAGMICCSLRHAGAELLGQRRGLAAYAERGSTMGIPLLYPWANRFGDWSYEALGRRVDLRGMDSVRADGETGLPIHGTLPRPWELLESAARRLVAEARPAGDAFPFDHRVRLSAELDGATLRVRATVLPADGEVPVAFGFHPYLTLPGVPRSEYRIELPPRRRLELDAHKLPTGAGEPATAFAGRLGELVFDDAIDELEQPALFAVEGGGRRIELRFEEGFAAGQVFAPAGGDFICFEPMTAPTDALRRGGYPVATAERPYSAAFSITVA